MDTAWLENLRGLHWVHNGGIVPCDLQVHVIYDLDHRGYVIVDHVTSQTQVKGINSQNSFYRLSLFASLRCLLILVSSTWPPYRHLNHLHAIVSGEAIVSGDGLSTDENVTSAPIWRCLLMLGRSHLVIDLWTLKVQCGSLRDDLKCPCWSSLLWRSLDRAGRMGSGTLWLWGWSTTLQFCVKVTASWQLR